MNRTLSLKRETLNELSTDELTSVNGAAPFDLTKLLTVCLQHSLRCYSLTTCITCDTGDHA